jgi:hypothetical protein
MVTHISSTTTVVPMSTLSPARTHVTLGGERSPQTSKQAGRQASKQRGRVPEELRVLVALGVEPPLHAVEQQRHHRREVQVSKDNTARHDKHAAAE